MWVLFDAYAMGGNEIIKLMVIFFVLGMSFMLYRLRKHRHENVLGVTEVTVKDFFNLEEASEKKRFQDRYVSEEIQMKFYHYKDQYQLNLTDKENADPIKVTISFDFSTINENIEYVFDPVLEIAPYEDADIVKRSVSYAVVDYKKVVFTLVVNVFGEFGPMIERFFEKYEISIDPFEKLSTKVK